MGYGTNALALGGPEFKQYLNKLMDAFTALWRDERGQATVEYILILTFSVTAAAALSRGLLAAVNQGVLSLGAQLEKDLKTGRAPAGIYVN